MALVVFELTVGVGNINYIIEIGGMNKVLYHYYLLL